MSIVNSGDRFKITNNVSNSGVVTAFSGVMEYREVRFDRVKSKIQKKFGKEIHDYNLQLHLGALKNINKINDI